MDSRARRLLGDEALEELESPATIIEELPPPSFILSFTPPTDGDESLESLCSSCVGNYKSKNLAVIKEENVWFIQKMS